MVYKFRLPRSTVVGDTIVVIFSQILVKGSLTLITILMARFLSVAELSKFNYFYVTGGMLGAYLAAGLPLAAMTIVSENNAERSWQSDRRTAGIVVTGLLASAIGIVTAPLYLPVLLPEEIVVSGPAILGGALIGTWAGLAQNALYANQGFRAAVPPIIVGTLALIAGAVAAAVTGRADVLIAGMIASALTSLILFAILLHGRGILPSLASLRRSEFGGLREVLAIAMPGVGVAVIFATMTWLVARTLVEHQASPDQFNQYALGMQWLSLALFIPLGFGQVIFPRYIAAARSGSIDLHAIAIPAGATFGFVLILAVVAAALTPLISAIYGSQYQFDPAFVFTVLLAAASGGTVNLLGYVVMAAKGTGTWFGVNLASVAAGVPILVLLPPDSAFEAARVLCASYLSMIAVSCLVIWRYRARVTRMGAARG